MIRLSFDPLAISGDPVDVTAFMNQHSVVIGDKEMAEMAGVSIATVSRWKRSPAFPRGEKGVTRLSFLQFLYSRKV